MSADNSTIEIHQNIKESEVSSSSIVKNNNETKIIKDESKVVLDNNNINDPNGNIILNRTNRSIDNQKNNDDSKVDLSTTTTYLNNCDKIVENTVETEDEEKLSVGKKRKSISKVEDESVKEDGENVISKRRRCVPKVDYTYSSFDKDIKDSIKNGKISRKRTATASKIKEDNSAKKKNLSKVDEKISVDEEHDKTTGDSSSNTINDLDNKDNNEKDEEISKNTDEGKVPPVDEISEIEIPSKNVDSSNV